MRLWGLLALSGAGGIVNGSDIKDRLRLQNLMRNIPNGGESLLNGKKELKFPQRGLLNATGLVSPVREKKTESQETESTDCLRPVDMIDVVFKPPLWPSSDTLYVENVGSCVKSCEMPGPDSAPLAFVSWGGDKGPFAKQCFCYRSMPVGNLIYLPGSGAMSSYRTLTEFAFRDAAPNEQFFTENPFQCETTCTQKGLCLGRASISEFTITKINGTPPALYVPENCRCYFYSPHSELIPAPCAIITLNMAPGILPLDQSCFRPCQLPDLCSTGVYFGGAGPLRGDHHAKPQRSYNYDISESDQCKYPSENSCDPTPKFEPPHPAHYGYELPKKGVSCQRSDNNYYQDPHKKYHHHCNHGRDSKNEEYRRRKLLDMPNQDISNQDISTQEIYNPHYLDNQTYKNFPIQNSDSLHDDPEPNPNPEKTVCALVDVKAWHTLRTKDFGADAEEINAGNQNMTLHYHQKQPMNDGIIGNETTNVDMQYKSFNVKSPGLVTNPENFRPTK